MKATHFYVGAFAALLPLAGAFAQSTAPAQPDPATQPAQQGATFESLDTDSDGRISKTEASVNANVTAQFASYDKNGNGFIEREEVNATNSPPADKPDKQ